MGVLSFGIKFSRIGRECIDTQTVFEANYAAARVFSLKMIKNNATV